LTNIVVVVLFKYYVFVNVKICNLAIDNKERHTNSLLQF